MIFKHHLTGRGPSIRRSLVVNVVSLRMRSLIRASPGPPGVAARGQGTRRAGPATAARWDAVGLRVAGGLSRAAWPAIQRMGCAHGWRHHYNSARCSLPNPSRDAAEPYNEPHLRGRHEGAPLAYGPYPGRCTRRAASQARCGASNLCSRRLPAYTGPTPASALGLAGRQLSSGPGLRTCWESVGAPP